MGWLTNKRAATKAILSLQLPRYVFAKRGLVKISLVNHHTKREVIKWITKLTK
jgi:hypothetical protein